MDNLDLSILTNGKPVLNNRERVMVDKAQKSGDNINQVLTRINYERTLTNKDRANLTKSKPTQTSTELTPVQITNGTTSTQVATDLPNDESPTITLTNREKKILREGELAKKLQQQQLEMNRVEVETQRLLEDRRRKNEQMEEEAKKRIDRHKAEANSIQAETQRLLEDRRRKNEQMKEDAERLIEWQRNETNLIIKEKADKVTAIKESMSDAEQYKKHVEHQILKEKQVELSELSKQISTLSEHKSLLIKSCSVCLEDINQVHTINPCGHTSTCVDCLKKLMFTTKLCPICRARMTGYIMTF